MKLNIGCLLTSILAVEHNFTPSLLKIFYACYSYENKNFDLKEPFKGLFTQAWYAMKHIKIRITTG